MTSAAIGREVWPALEGSKQLEVLRSPYFLALLVMHVETAGELPGHRDADDGQCRLRRDDSRQMRRKAGGTDEHLHATRDRAADIGLEQIGCAMGRNHSQLVHDGQLRERVGSLLDDLEVRPATDDDRDERLHGQSVALSSVS